MKIWHGLAAAAALTMMTSSAAFAGALDSAYLGVTGGAVFPEDIKDGTGKLENDTGWAAGATIGLRWKGGWRTELEGLHRENDWTVTDSGFPGEFAKGNAKSNSLMLNAIKDFDVGGPVFPYIGVGVGGTKVLYQTEALSANVSGNGSEGWGGIYQAIAGLSVPFSKAVEGYIQYNYFRTFEVDDGIDDTYRGHQLLVGLRWSFWNAPEPVAAAPAPAPVAQPKDYVIYFEFNKANVTKAAGAVLDEVKSTSGNATASVVGHTDTVGSSGYNQKLSEKRAKNTAAGLTDRGVKVDSVSGRGFSDPAVKTGPGVKEPLNRRAVITLQ